MTLFILETSIKITLIKLDRGIFYYFFTIMEQIILLESTIAYINSLKLVKQIPISYALGSKSTFQRILSLV